MGVRLGFGLDDGLDWVVSQEVLGCIVFEVEGNVLLRVCF